MKHYNSYHKQQGSTLFMVLFVLTSLLIVSLALLRSTSTTTLMAGNIAFKQASSVAAGIGINNSIIALQNVINREASVPDVYFATVQPTDQYGLPTTVIWSQVPSQLSDKYKIQQVIERLCVGPTPVADPDQQCSYIENTESSSSKLGSTQFSSKLYYYRVTVMVTGPKNTNSFIQAIVSQ